MNDLEIWKNQNEEWLIQKCEAMCEHLCELTGEQYTLILDKLVTSGKDVYHVDKSNRVEGYLMSFTQITFKSSLLDVAIMLQGYIWGLGHENV